MPSYNSQTISSDAVLESQRLQAQADLFWESEREIFHLIGLRDGMRILEVGCSGGHYTEKLTQQYPNTSIVAIDSDELAVSAARARPALAAMGTNLVVRHQSVEALDDIARFDAVIARLVVEHLDQPESALQRMLQSLVPGGVVICISNDFGWHTLHSPDVAMLPTLFGAYRQARQAQGGNPTVGRDLPRLLATAGFAEVGLRAVVAHSDLTGLDKFRAAEGIGIAMKLVADGLLSPADLSSIIADSRSTQSCVRVLLAANGRRPR